MNRNDDIYFKNGLFSVSPTYKISGTISLNGSDSVLHLWSDKVADSSHKCNKRFRFSIFLNQLREYLPRGLKPQAFARPMVHLIDRGAHLVLAELVEDHAFGEVLA